MASIYEKMMNGDRKAVIDMPKPSPKEYYSVSQNHE